MTPIFITFTGADDNTNVIGMVHLASVYPIEWGILFSPDRQGIQPRYPSWTTIHKIGQLCPRDSLSAHLCGGYSRQLLASANTSIDDSLLEYFGRVQVNTSMRGIDTMAIRTWGASLGVQPILQCRSAFPEDINVEWLFDTSGGRGTSPEAWPTPPNGNHRTGYAGGLNPENVAAAVAEIGSQEENFWIDMETGVRDENDRFSLAKCLAVCEAVYGSRNVILPS